MQSTVETQKVNSHKRESYMCIMKKYIYKYYVIYSYYKSECVCVCVYIILFNNKIKYFIKMTRPSSILRGVQMYVSQTKLTGTR